MRSLESGRRWRRGRWLLWPLLGVVTFCLPSRAPSGEKGDASLPVVIHYSCKWNNWRRLDEPGGGRIAETGTMRVTVNGKVRRGKKRNLIFDPVDVSATCSYQNTGTDIYDGTKVWTETGGGTVPIRPGKQMGVSMDQGVMMLTVLRGLAGTLAAMQMAGQTPPMDRDAIMRLRNDPTEVYQLLLLVPVRTKVENHKRGTTTASGRAFSLSACQLYQHEDPMRGQRTWTSTCDMASGDRHAITLIDLPAVSAMSPKEGDGMVTEQISWRIGGIDYQVGITAPKLGENFVYSLWESGRCTVEAAAEASPSSYSDQIFPWQIDGIAGSKLTKFRLEDGKKKQEDPLTGPKVRFRFDKLPTDNREFGAKMISCDSASPVTVKIFYGRLFKDHKLNGVPVANWYYYWRQGCVPGLGKFQYIQSATDYGGFTAPDTLEISDMASGVEKAYTLLLRCRQPDGTWKFTGSMAFPTRKGCDLCHATILHELYHKRIYDLYVGKGDPDRDGDELPDWFETLGGRTFELDPDRPDTHGLRLQISSEYATYGDQELLCRIQEFNSSPNVSEDWSWLGKQSDPQQ